MIRHVLLALCLGAALAGGTVVAQQPSAERLKDPSQFTEQAPAEYRARFDTSKGPFVIEVRREVAPLAADRFFNLVKNGKPYSGYGRQNVPDQRRIVREGNAYLQAEYPQLDFVRRATIEP